MRKRVNSAHIPGPLSDTTLKCKLHKSREDSKVRLTRYAVEFILLAYAQSKLLRNFNL